MHKTDGISLASAAAALLMSSAMLPAMAAANTDLPVKTSQCQGLTSCHGQSACKAFGNTAGPGENSCSAVGFVAISSGHEMLSKSLCERLGGTQVGSLAQAPGAKIGDALVEDAASNPVQVAYCNDVFTCNGFSACKGNGNDNCAGINTCHGIGFVGISSGDLELSKQLCEKLGGSVLSSL